MTSSDLTYGMSPLPVDPTDLAVARREQQRTARVGWPALGLALFSLLWNPLLLVSSPAGVLAIWALIRLHAVPNLHRPLVPSRTRTLLTVASTFTLFIALTAALSWMMELQTAG